MPAAGQANQSLRRLKQWPVVGDDMLRDVLNVGGEKRQCLGAESIAVPEMAGSARHPTDLSAMQCQSVVVELLSQSDCLASPRVERQVDDRALGDALCEGRWPVRWPDRAVLERRERLGGTWDLFGYPGIRPDSDMLNFGYKFRPLKVLADGPSIPYTADTAVEYRVDAKYAASPQTVAASVLDCMCWRPTCCTGCPHGSHSRCPTASRSSLAAVRRGPGERAPMRFTNWPSVAGSAPSGRSALARPNTIDSSMRSKRRLSASFRKLCPTFHGLCVPDFGCTC